MISWHAIARAASGPRGRTIASRLACGIVALVCLASCADTGTVERSAAVEAIAAKVSGAEIERTISDLVAFETRFPYEKQLAVADYLHERLRAHIPEAAFHEYEHWGVKWKNVVATIPGRDRPEEVVVVCAHLDSKSPARLAFAPGADDNASGCAAVVELARILAEHSFERSIRFIVFSQEENGQIGSKEYLKSIDRGRERIYAALNLDMIAYGPDTEEIDLVTRPRYRWLADRADAAARAHGLPTKKIVKRACY